MFVRDSSPLVTETKDVFANYTNTAIEVGIDLPEIIQEMSRACAHRRPGQTLFIKLFNQERE